MNIGFSNLMQTGVGAAQSSIETKAKSLSASAENARDDEKLKDACKGFESIFLGMMLGEMRKTVQKTHLMGDSRAEDMFQDMMDKEICEATAQTQPIGLADMMYKQMSRLSSNVFDTTKTQPRGEGQ